MPAYQYIYVMKGLSKTFPGGREVLKDIWLSFLPGAMTSIARANAPASATKPKSIGDSKRASMKGRNAPRVRVRKCHVTIQPAPRAVLAAGEPVAAEIAARAAAKWRSAS